MKRFRISDLCFFEFGFYLSRSSPIGQVGRSNKKCSLKILIHSHGFKYHVARKNFLVEFRWQTYSFSIRCMSQCIVVIQLKAAYGLIASELNVCDASGCASDGVEQGNTANFCSENFQEKNKKKKLFLPCYNNWQSKHRPCYLAKSTILYILV